jgi:hypothetical protein
MNGQAASMTVISIERIPPLPHGKVWIVASLLTVGLVVFMETLARLGGYVGMPSDDMGLWALERSRVRDNDPSQVVLVGSSQMQMGIDPETWGEACNCAPPIQLAIVASSSLPVLQHLAAQKDFKGMVLCDVFPSITWTEERANHEAPPRQNIQYYENRNYTTLFERRMKLEVELAFASLNNRFRLGRALSGLIKKGEIPKPYFSMTGGRTRRVDCTLVDPKRKEFSRESVSGIHPLGPEGLLEVIRQMEAAVAEIQARGGRVVYIRLPIVGGVKDIENELFPREKFWDVLAGNTRAASVHFEDFAELSDFQPPDGSHLDYRDAKRFTKVLSEVIQRDTSNSTLTRS